MAYNKASAKDRKKIFEAFQEDRDWKAVAKMCDVKPGTAYKWLINGSATAKPKGGSASKKTPEITAALETIIEENASITLTELRDIVGRDFSIHVCKNTIKNWLDGEMYSVKDVRTIVDRMNHHDNKEKRILYMTKLFEAQSAG